MSALIALHLLPAGAAAQSVPPDIAYFDHLSRSNGLSNSSVSSIVEDEDGFLWFGTQAGLNRYDGRRFTVYQHRPFDRNSLPHNLVQTLYGDPHEPVLWIGTYNGLSRFDVATKTFTNYGTRGGGTALSNAVVTAVVRDAAGIVWIGTLDGLNRLDPETGEIDRVAGAAGEVVGTSLPHQTVRSLHIDDEGRLWVGTYGGLSVIDEGRRSLRTVLDGSRMGAAAVMDIVQAGTPTLWLGVWGTGLAGYDPATDHVHTYPLPDERVYTVASRRGRYMFAGSWGGGLFRVDTFTGEVSNFSHAEGREFGLSNDTVYSLTFDDAGALWIGTNGGGVNRLSERRVYRVRFESNPNEPGSLTSGKVTAIHRHADGTLWVGTYNGGLNRYDDSADRMIHFRADGSAERRISNDIITTIFESADGTLWVGTNDGLNRYLPDQDAFTTYRADSESAVELPGDIVYALEQEEPGLLWVGTYSNGVALWDPEEGIVEAFSHRPADPESLSDNLVYDIHRDRSGRIWVATNRGLNRFDRESRSWVRYLHNPEDRTSISYNTCGTIHEAEDGTLWIGTTGGGLNRYVEESDSFESYTRRDGLPSNSISGILEDKEGRLWISTTNGISVFNPETEHVRNLDEEDGIGGLEFGRGTMRDRDGSLWFGGFHGITVLDGPIRQPNPHPPRIHVTGVSVLGEPLEAEGTTFDGNTISLDHDENSVSFEFVALDYASPEKNTYRYKLEGFDSDWTYGGTRNYTNYTRLPGGEYIFVVEGMNADGVPSTGYARVNLEVARSPWMRWWAVTAYVAAGLLLVLIVARLRERQVLARRVVELDHQRTALAEISVRDGLTGLYNRRYFDLKLADTLETARRSSLSLSLVMLDIDQFKRYNDLYGHPQGDACLKAIATVLSESVERGSDFVARYGGEEFAVILFDTDCRGAERVATRIRERVQDRGLSYPDSSNPSVVTVSAGFCSLRVAENATAADLVCGADEALYAAKRAGRNRVSGCTPCTSGAE